MKSISVKLQKPKYVYFGGKIRLYEEAVFHISTEAVLRGLNVFEGTKGYWQTDGSFGIIALKRHFNRLKRSAKILAIPFETNFDEFEQAHHDLVRLLYSPDQNMWVRATLYVEEGHWGVGTKSNLVLTAYHQPKGQPEMIDAGVSTWQRSTDISLPCRIKTSTNYQVARLARMEGNERGYSEMILLNQWGRVAEGTGSCVLMVRGEKVYTPPVWEGCLESITVDLVGELCKSMGIPFERRPIERTELIIADEIAFAGTLVEVTPIRSLDGVPMPEPKILNIIARRYLNAATGIEPYQSMEMSFIPPNSAEQSLIESFVPTRIS
jgi:branched-chain amino acid aminotransferase